MVCDNSSVGEVTGSTHRGSAVPKGQTVSVGEAESVALATDSGVEVNVSVAAGGAVRVGVSVCVGKAAVKDETAVSEAVATCRVGSTVAVPGAQRTRMTAISSRDGISKTFLIIFFMVLSKFTVRKDVTISDFLLRFIRYHILVSGHGFLLLPLKLQSAT